MNLSSDVKAKKLLIFENKSVNESNRNSFKKKFLVSKVAIPWEQTQFRMVYTGKWIQLKANKDLLIHYVECLNAEICSSFTLYKSHWLNGKVDALGTLRSHARIS